ncbi:MAG: hypothetical protein AAF197_09370, partial [Pseudomonadota bacterium]
MNYPRTLFFALATGLLISNPVATSAGFLDDLLDKVEDSVENVVQGKAANKAGEKAGEAADSVLNPKSSEPEQESQAEAPANAEASGSAQAGGSMGGLSGMLSALGKQAKIDDNYRFDITVESEVVHNGETNVMTQSYGRNAFMVTTQPQQKMILDINNESMIIVDEARKTKQAMSTDFIKAMASMAGGMIKNQVGETLAPENITRSGETKMIADHMTEQWVFEDDERRGEVWLATDIEFDFVEFNQ